MMVEDLSAFLQANAGITSIAAGRVYPMPLPQKATMPAVIFQQVAGVRMTSLEGVGKWTADLFQINAMAADYKTVKQLAEKVRLALDGFSGTMGGTKVFAAFLENERDYWDPLQLDYRIDLDFKIWHTES